jgi:hypothetical protein
MPLSFIYDDEVGMTRPPPPVTKTGAFTNDRLDSIDGVHETVEASTWNRTWAG